MSAAPSAPGTPGGLQYYYFDPAAGFTSAQMTSLASGLAMWSAVANIQFAQTTDLSQASLDFTGVTSGGTFEFNPIDQPELDSSTTLNNQGPGTYLQINTDPNNGGFDLGNFNNGGSGVGVILHEEGHFLGLGHAGPYNGGADPATQQYSVYDSHEYSLMSYIAADDPTGKYAASYPLGSAANPLTDSTTWMPLDILAAQSLYGVATTTPLSGGQVFGFHDNIVGALEPYFDFTTIQNPFVTLFDTGAGNTLDLSGYSTPETVDLRPGAYSSFNGEVFNLAIAYNTAIDTFVGGTGGTDVTVNAQADTIKDAGAGNQVDFSGTLASYLLAGTTALVDVTSIATGVTDVLTDVQTLMFSDQTISTVNLCFLQGVMIETPKGEVAVEALSVGEMVSTRLAGRTVARPVTWIGRRHVVVGAGAADERYPVRVRSGAFADAVPSRDLLVTSEHCLHVDGKLIPARLLVNGSSIIVDRSITAFTYFHVELAQHAILIADGMEAESYLDTGNRGNFADAPVTTMVPDFALDAAHRSWASDAAAPLAVDQATVEPIWRRLHERSSASGFRPASPLTTSDPSLRLEAAGRLLRPVHFGQGRALFMLSRAASSVRLLSRAARPSDTRPWLDDRRQLGVCVRRILLPQGSGREEIPLEQLAASRGWHDVEGIGDHAFRWTDGEAEIPGPVAAGVVEFKLAGETRYLLESPLRGKAAA